MDAAHLDGNAVGGPLADLFAFDVTVARTICTWCGDTHVVAELMAYVQGPGTVLRCSSCGEVQLRFVQAGTRAWLDATGISAMEVEVPVSGDQAAASQGAGPAGLEVDQPDVVAEVLATFERYEAALVAGDVDVLDELFWSSPATVRYGFDDVQHGHAAVSAFRRSLPVQTPARTLVDTTVTTFGRDVATVTTEFVDADRDGRGRQSQTWVRFGGGWRVVSAHVSWPGAPPAAI